MIFWWILPFGENQFKVSVLALWFVSLDLLKAKAGAPGATAIFTV